jgi:flotillin
LTKSKLENDTEIARAKRAFDVKKAEYDTEVNTAKAEADLAYNLRVT